MSVTKSTGAHAFLSADPIPHQVIDQFLAPELMRELVLELPGEPSLLPDEVRAWGRAYRALEDLLASAPLIDRLRELSGLRGLLYDPTCPGGRLAQQRGEQWYELNDRFGAHPRAWHACLGMVLHLTDGGGALSLSDGEAAPRLVEPRANRCVLFRAGAGGRVVFQTTADSPPARTLHACFYARHRPRPVVQAPRPSSPAQMPTPTPTPASMRPAVVRLRPKLEAFQPGGQPDGHQVAAFRRLVDDLGEDLSRLLAQERQAAREYVDELSRVLHDGSAPLTTEESEAVRHVLGQQAQVSGELRARALALAASTRKLCALPRVPHAGPIVVEEHDGFWRDRWVTSSFRLRVRAEKPIRTLKLKGWVPTELDPDQELEATLQDRVYQQKVTGAFEWTLPVAAAAGESIELEIRSSLGWTPSETGASADSRLLAWLLTQLVAE